MEWKWDKPTYIPVLIAIISILIWVGVTYYNRSKGISTYDPRQAILQESRKQILFSLNLDTLFLDYEAAINDYIKTPNSQTLNKMLTLGRNLDESLNQAGDIYGLNVKRWVNLFQVWQYYAEQRLQQVSNNEKEKAWHESGMGGNFLTYQIQINNQIDVSKQDYNNDSRNILLYGDSGLKQADSKTQAYMDTLFNQKAAQFLPQALQDLKEHKRGIMSCTDYSMSDLDNNPQNLANMVAFIQYQSRYCGFAVRSKTESYCNKIRRLPSIDGKMKILNETLAVCQIAEKRLQVEKEAAQQKYGNLSYNDYFTKFVAPLLPKYTEMLQTQAKDQNRSASFYACNPNFLPVVDFRDPNVDAQIAAYETNSATACHAYFANSCNDFEMRQATKYSLQSQNKS